MDSKEFSSRLLEGSLEVDRKRYQEISRRKAELRDKAKPLLQKLDTSDAFALHHNDSKAKAESDRIRSELEKIDDEQEKLTQEQLVIRRQYKSQWQSW